MPRRCSLRSRFPRWIARRPGYYAQATTASIWEVFELETLQNGTFTLRTLDSHPKPNQYVRAHGGGGGLLSADRLIANAHEKFTRVELAHGKVAICMNDLSYWRAVNLGGDKLDCRAAAQRAWETFTIEPV